MIERVGAAGVLAAGLWLLCLSLCLLLAAGCDAHPLPLAGAGADAGPFDAPRAGFDGGEVRVFYRVDGATEPRPDLYVEGRDVAADPVRDAAVPLDAPNGQGCNTVAQLGAQVTIECSMGLAPTPQGGTIVDGTYVLTSAAWFGGCLGVVTSLAETAVFAGGTVQAVADIPGIGIARSNESYTISGTSITETRTCPDRSIATTGFDATPGMIRLFTINSSSVTLVSVFTRL